MKFLLSYSKAISKSLTGLLTALPDSMAPDSIHALRIEIKRMRSLLDLINFIERKSKLREPEILSELFKAAGRLREVQIEQEWILHFNFDDETGCRIYHTVLCRQEKKRRLALDSIMKGFRMKMFESYCKELENRTGGITERKAMFYIEKVYSRLQKKFHRKGYKRSQLHKLRIGLKNIYFIIEAIRKTESKRAIHENSKERILQLQNLIGKWHDSSIALSNLENYQRNSKKPLRRSYDKMEMEYKKTEKRLFLKAEESAKKYMAQDLIIS